MARKVEPLYVGTNRFVAAIEPRTGEELWRTKLSGGGLGSPVTILIKDKHLYVGHYGRVHCLDRRDGSVRWSNGLSKMGFHAVLLAMEGAQGSGDAGLVVDDQRRRGQAAAGATAGGA